jgi:hypothetical protein
MHHHIVAKAVQHKGARPCKASGVLHDHGALLHGCRWLQVLTLYERTSHTVTWPDWNAVAKTLPHGCQAQHMPQDSPSVTSPTSSSLFLNPAQRPIVMGTIQHQSATTSSAARGSCQSFSENDTTQQGLDLHAQHQLGMQMQRRLRKPPSAHKCFMFLCHHALKSSDWEALKAHSEGNRCRT